MLERIIKKISEKEEEQNKILERITNLELKKEGLGALEFDIQMAFENFEERKVSFRIERVTGQTYLKIAAKEKLETLVPETFKNFIAAPLEARELNFFDYDIEALNIIGQLINKFQSTPILFARG